MRVGIISDSFQMDQMELLRRARAGDRDALNELCETLLAPLKTWASGRLPPRARTLLDTDDLVQETIVRTIDKLGGFEPKHERALEVYLRRGLMNRVRDEIRKAESRPVQMSHDGTETDSSPSPIEDLIGLEKEEVYEAALRTLRPADREAITARVDLRLSFERTATLLGKPTAAAARVAIRRALLRLAHRMSQIEAGKG